MALARVDQHLRRGRFEQALEELGGLPKRLQEEPLVRQYVERALEGLYGPPPGAKRKYPIATRARGRAHVRVARRQKNVQPQSDQDFDNRGWQINTHAEATAEGKETVDGRFVVDLDGFKNGHNDLRYRTLLADFFEKPGLYGPEGPSHLVLGDRATFPSYYFMRGSRLRGVNFLHRGQKRQFQALLGVYPFWLEDRDEYIYPRMVWGLRNRWRLFEDKFRFGANLVQTRDSEKIRSINTVRQPRDNTVYSFDQQIQLIPKIWRLNAYEAYSYTDDNLIENRFGDNVKLKDTAFRVESYMTQPWFRWNARLERTGPDFRLLADLPAGAVNNVKGLTADRLFVGHTLDLNRLGPFDLDLAASWYRNDLDNAADVEETRQAWYTANLGIALPSGWPRPRLRALVIDTISSPGSPTRPAETRLTDLRGELTHRLEGMRLSAFGTYRVKHPLKGGNDNTFSPTLVDNSRVFVDEIRWTAGGRVAVPLAKRASVQIRYRYEDFLEFFNEELQDGKRHEADVSGSYRLWDTASVSAHYTFQSGNLIHSDPAAARLIHTNGHSMGASFLWPYRWLSPDKRRKLTLTPSASFYLTDLDGGLSRRPMVTGRLDLGYDVVDSWRAELRGEYRYDTEESLPDVRTEETRFWLLLSNRWQ